jgi:hypothetical protein
MTYTVASPKTDADWEKLANIVRKTGVPIFPEVGEILVREVLRLRKMVRELEVSQATRDAAQR